MWNRGSVARRPARYLLTWPGSHADAQRVAEAAAFSKRNVSETLISFVKSGVIEETWPGIGFSSPFRG